MVGPDDSGRPLDAICDEILSRYHAALHRALPRIRHKLARLTEAAANPALLEMSIAFAGLADQIEAHLAKEENLLFPALESLAEAERSGANPPALPFSTVLHPIRLMESEHLRIEEALDRLREIALAVAEPESLSPAWHDCMAELSQLDIDLREHHRTEDALLFPRAIELERRLF